MIIQAMPYPIVLAGADIEYVGGYILGDDVFTATNTIPLDSLTGGIDTAARTGDFVLVVFGWNLNSDIPRTINTAGYTQFLHKTQAVNGGLNLCTGAGYKILTSEETSVEVSAPNSGSSGSVRAVHVWRGVDPDNPIDVSPVTASAGGTGQADPPEILSGTSGAIAVSAGFTGGYYGADNLTSAELENQIADITNNATFDTALLVGSLPLGMDGANPNQFGGGSVNASAAWVAFTLGLRPAVPAEPFPVIINSEVQRVSGAMVVRPNKEKDYVSRISGAVVLRIDPTKVYASRVSGAVILKPTP